MSVLRLAHCKKMQQEMNIPLRLKILSVEKNQSFAKLSLNLGMNKNFLNQKKRKHDFSCAEIMALSHYLDTNLFEWFSDRLPAHIRPTKKETELLQQVADLQKQISDLEKERDWLKGVIGGK